MSAQVNGDHPVRPGQRASEARHMGEVAAGAVQHQHPGPVPAEVAGGDRHTTGCDEYVMHGRDPPMMGVPRRTRWTRWNPWNPWTRWRPGRSRMLR